MLKKLLKIKNNMDTIEMCRRCHSFRYEDEWHFDRPDYLTEENLGEKVFVRFSQCNACLEEALSLYDVEYI